MVGIERSPDLSEPAGSLHATRYQCGRRATTSPSTLDQQEVRRHEWPGDRQPLLPRQGHDRLRSSWARERDQAHFVPRSRAPRPWRRSSSAARCRSRASTTARRRRPQAGPQPLAGRGILDKARELQQVHQGASGHLVAGPGEELRVKSTSASRRGRPGGGAFSSASLGETHQLAPGPPRGRATGAAVAEQAHGRRAPRGDDERLGVGRVICGRGDLTRPPDLKKYSVTRPGRAARRPPQDAEARAASASRTPGCGRGP